MPNNEITLDVSGGGSADVTLETTPGTGTEIEMDTQASGGSDGPYARKAEAWAVGKRGGVDVPSTDETYHNNSKYWAENASFLRAQLAVMVGNLEGLDQEWEDAKDELVEELTGTVEDAQSEIQEDMDALRELRQRLIDDGLRKIAGPNLLKQNFWTSRDMPSSAVITETLTVPAETAAEAAEPLTFTVTNEAITSSYKLHGVKTSNYEVVSWAGVSATFTSGSATITIAARSGAHNGAVTVNVALCTQSSQSVVYGNASRISGSTYPYLKSISAGWYPGDDSADNIYCTVAALSGANVVNDLDGESYDKAIQYNITEGLSYSSTEWLQYYHSNSSILYTPGATNIRNYGHIEEMTPGHRYTVSCWARVISGSGAVVRFGFGNNYGNVPYNKSDGTSGVSDWIEISGSAWQRYSWTFDFNPTGDWYTETSETVTVNGQSETRTRRSYNWNKCVWFGVGRKYTAVIQLCGFRMHEGDMWAPDLSGLMADYESLHQRQLSLEAVQLNLFGAAGNEF